MKYLLIILIIANVYCACRSDEYLWNGYCLHCNSSPCSACNGSRQCARCFDGIWDRRTCDVCTRPNSMVINGRCRSCSEIDANLDGEYCKCNLASPPLSWIGQRRKCCENVPGVYADGSLCKPCSKELIGCNTCDPPTRSGMLRCKTCSSGFNLLTVGEAKICVSNFRIYNFLPPPPCHNSCQTCLSSEPTECLTCVAGLYYLQNSRTGDSSAGRCLTDCPSGYSRRETPFRQCESQRDPPRQLEPDNCGSGCSTCTETIRCTECRIPEDVIRNNEECIPNESCRNGYSVIHSTPRRCKKCGNKCDTCDSLSDCLTCIHGYILWNKECLLNSEGYRGFLSSGIAVALFLLTFF